MSTGTSDHCLIILTCQTTTPRRASFKFENFWIHINGFREVVQQAWSKQQISSAHSVLSEKLSATAKALKAWSKPLFSKARMQLHIANEIILRLDMAEEDRLLSDDE